MTSDWSEEIPILGLKLFKNSYSKPWEYGAYRVKIRQSQRHKNIGISLFICLPIEPSIALQFPKLRVFWYFAPKKGSVSVDFSIMGSYLEYFIVQHSFGMTRGRVRNKGYEYEAFEFSLGIWLSLSRVALSRRYAHKQNVHAVHAKRCMEAFESNR